MTTMPTDTLEIRLLGKLEVVRAGRVCPLPPSRQARALLAYLVATGRRHTREYLCDLLWDGPADPRAALRWSLAKLRPILNSEGTVRLKADRKQVGFEHQDAAVDLITIRELVEAEEGQVSTEALKRAAACIRGAFLEGFHLADNLRFEAWLGAERESVHREHASILETLIEQLQGEPEEALCYARKYLFLDPLSETAHASVIRLLVELGRKGEAQEAYAQFRVMWGREFGSDPAPEMQRLGAAISEDQPAVRTRARRSSPVSRPESPLVGRSHECATLRRLMENVHSGTLPDVILITGAPGIGKTRLLTELASWVAEDGGRVLSGRCYEAERIRPYGPWYDALRSIHPDEMPPSLNKDLAALLPESRLPPPQESDQNRLFGAVLRLLAHEIRRSAPLAILLDDVHWLDGASVALLHYVIRNARAGNLLIACAARGMELDENPAVARMMQSLRREDRLRGLSLEPLSADDTGVLLQSTGIRADAAAVFAESRGNPLFAFEVARALDRGGIKASGSLRAVITERLVRLDAGAQALLPWAAALGHVVRMDVLARVTERSAEDLLGALEVLEQGGILQPLEAVTYEFTHDLVRQAVYEQLSAPRRRLIHLQIARALARTDGGQDHEAGTIAHHAALGGDAGLAAHAFMEAARHALRVFAYADAAVLAERGMDQLTALSEPERCAHRIGLLELYLHPGMVPHRQPAFETEVRQAIRDARAEGLQALVREGFYLLAQLFYQRGDFARAMEDMERAEEAGRACDPITVIRAVANSACCLIMIDQEWDRARRLTLEAQELTREISLLEAPSEVPMALGLLRQHDGEFDEAIRFLEQALRDLRQEGDRWWECFCLLRLPMIELERGDPKAALERCREAMVLAAKMGEGSEAPFAASLEALARLALGEPDASGQVDAAVQRLREVDSKWMLAYVQVFAAGLEAQAGQAGRARNRAEEALTAADAVNRRNEWVQAHALLARLDLQQGDETAAASHLEAVQYDLGRSDVLSVRTRRAIEETAEILAA